MFSHLEAQNLIKYHVEALVMLSSRVFFHSLLSVVEQLLMREKCGPSSSLLGPREAGEMTVATPVCSGSLCFQCNEEQGNSIL